MPVGHDFEHVFLVSNAKIRNAMKHGIFRELTLELLFEPPRRVSKILTTKFLHV